MPTQFCTAQSSLAPSQQKHTTLIIEDLMRFHRSWGMLRQAKGESMALEYVYWSCWC